MSEQEDASEQLQNRNGQVTMHVSALMLHWIF